MDADKTGGSGWESNPPPALSGTLVLKTRRATRPQTPPGMTFYTTSIRPADGPIIWPMTAPKARLSDS